MRGRRHFCDDTHGAYAIEFALTGSILIVLIMISFQYVMIYLARSSLNLALETATRSILTGAFQQANAGSSNQAQILANLKSSICGVDGSTRAWMFACANLKIDVNVAASFSGNSVGSTIIDSKTGTWSSNFGTGYVCPGPKSIAVVRAAVKYPVFARGISFGLSDFSDGSALIQSAVVFRVEQYQSGSGTSC